MPDIIPGLRIRAVRQTGISALEELRFWLEESSSVNRFNYTVSSKVISTTQKNEAGDRGRKD